MKRPAAGLKGLEAGFIVDITADGRDGLYLALENNYRLVILDIIFALVWMAGKC